MVMVDWTRRCWAGPGVSQIVSSALIYSLTDILCVAKLEDPYPEHFETIQIELWRSVLQSARDISKQLLERAALCEEMLQHIQESMVHGEAGG